ncbi:hypothetical protein Ancab_001285 [Ancistrocladus abbreviatus]
MLELGPHFPCSVSEEEGTKRKRSLEDGGGDRFANEASMKDCFDEPEPEPKPKLKLKLKLSAPKTKRTRRYVNPKLMQFNEAVGRRSFRQEENIDHEGIVAEQNQFAAQAGLEELNKQQQAKNGPLYELVNHGLCNPWLYKALFYHANFEAKPIGAPDSETQIFFVEIGNRYYEDPPYVVHFCCPVEKLPPVCRGAELHQGCFACECAYIYHPPAGGFRRGCRQYVMVVDKSHPLMP